MKKSKSILSAVRIVLLVLTLVWLIIEFIRYRNASVDAYDRSFICVCYLLAYCPVLLEELILFRSMNRILDVNIGKWAKICCIVSASLMFCALVFQFLVFTEAITKDMLFQNASPTLGAPSSRLLGLLLLTEWPVMIVSFILSCIQKTKRR